MKKKELWDLVWRFALTLLLVIVSIRILYYPERARIEDYRDKLSISHRVTKGYINAITYRKNLIDYNFIVNGVKYSGKSRYSLLEPPYPEKGDSIEVYYKDDDPNVNLWRCEFPE